VLSQLASTVAEARRGLDAYDATGAGRRIERFVHDLSNWYVRRARRRFWDPARGSEGSVDKRAAYATLHECLVKVATLLAPFTPFIAEELWRGLAAGHDGEPESVHLVDYPTETPDRIDARLDAAMEAARTIVSLGRTIRTEAKVRTRQPLSHAVVHFAGDRAALEELLDVVASELNVKEVVFAGSAEELGRWRAKPSFRVLGPRLGQGVKQVAAALGADDGSLAGALARGDTVRVSIRDGDSVELGPDDVELAQETLEGWGVAAEGSVTVALELAVSPELRLEGLAREVVRVVQDARKAAGLEVADRIALGLEAAGTLADAIEAHRDLVAGETLAVELGGSDVPGALHREDAMIDGMRLSVSIAKR